MDYRQLGRTDLKVSSLSLGSMTWGTQNTEAEGHAQIDMALDHGINFIDTAEMYPTTPMSKETQGETERIIGTWIAGSGKRDKIVLATKITGEGNMNVRDGAPITRETLEQALASSLRSLQTDYIDLYQLHWPNRGSYMFRQNWTFDPSAQDSEAVAANMIEVLETLDKFVKEGKVRHVGLSNESAWGTMRWLQIAEAHGYPRMQSIQNEYSLLCRLYDTDMAELSHHEDVGLLAFSPLAAGLLTGKYSGGDTPAGSRRSINDSLGGRINPRIWPAIDSYLAIADKHGLDPVHMALAWCQQRPFMTSAIFGATSLEQLERIIKGKDLVLGEDVMGAINDAHRAHPLPY
ncbi:aldo/keto reductase [Alphaproteobacteria bacterium LSUCC0684]